MLRPSPKLPVLPIYRSLLWLGALSLIAGSVAHGQTQSASVPYRRCMTRAGGSTVQQGMCAQAELTRQDARLNRVYGRLISRYPAGDPRRLELRNSERAWLTERDRSCQRNRDTVDNSCLIDQTQQRAAELERRANS